MADKKGVLTMTGDVTAAQATLFQQATRGRGSVTRKPRAKRISSVRPTRRGSRRPSKRKSKGAKLVKGSAAAKRRMAKLRAMQKRR